MRSLTVIAVLAAVGLAAPAVLAQQPAAGAGTVTATEPGKGTVANVVKLTAAVEAVDAANRTVTLKGPRGKVVTLPVGQDVKNFDQIKVGDQVEATYTEALAISVEPAPKPAAKK